MCETIIIMYYTDYAHNKTRRIVVRTPAQYDRELTRLREEGYRLKRVFLANP